MSRRKGKRYDDTPKLNIEKVIATLIAIVVFVMVIVSIKKLLTQKPKTKEVSAEDTYFSVHIGDKWGVIDNNGNIVIDTVYDEMVVVPDKNKDLFICTYDFDYENENYSTKVLNKNREQILTDYSQIQAIENTDEVDIWYENNLLKFKENEKYGLIDFSGKVILNAEYDNIFAMDGIRKSIIIEKDGKKGLVNSSIGEVIINPEYDEITTLTKTYENGYIVKKDGKCGIISANGKTVFEPVYEEIKNVTSNGYYAVVENGKLKMINDLGKDILTTGFDTIEDINGENIIITLNGKYGVISFDGTVLINPEYEELRYIYGTYYIAKKSALYGIISTTDEVKIDFTYTTMEYVKSADFIQADDENYKTDLIDREFNIVLQDIIISDLNLDDGYLRVREGNDYNYYNFKFEKKTSKEVLSTNTLFLIKENGKYGYENKNGERIVDAIYDDAKEQNKFGYCAVKKDGKWGALKSDGTVIVAPSIDMEEHLYVDFIGSWYLDKDINLNVYTK